MKNLQSLLQQEVSYLPYGTPFKLQLIHMFNVSVYCIKPQKNAQKLLFNNSTRPQLCQSYYNNTIAIKYDKIELSCFIIYCHTSIKVKLNKWTTRTKERYHKFESSVSHHFWKLTEQPPVDGSWCQCYKTVFNLRGWQR